MSLVGTITSNPDFAALVSAGVAYLGKQLWNRAKEKTEGDIWDTALKVAYQAFPRLLNDPKLYDDEHVREVITKTIWKGLERVGVPRNPTIEKLVAEVVEHAVGELATKVMDYHFGRLQKPLQGTLDALKKLPDDKPIGLVPETA